jgi:cysteine sulfinate desulfinase/cysteine desulfurase-like protein
VLKAIGVADTTAVLRFSLSRLTTEDEVRAAVAALGEAVREVAAVAASSRKAARAR